MSSFLLHCFLTDQMAIWKLFSCINEREEKTWNTRRKGQRVHGEKVFRIIDRREPVQPKLFPSAWLSSLTFLFFFSLLISRCWRTFRRTIYMRSSPTPFFSLFLLLFWYADVFSSVLAEKEEEDGEEKKRKTKGKRARWKASSAQCPFHYIMSNNPSDSISILDDLDDFS